MKSKVAGLIALFVLASLVTSTARAAVLRVVVVHTDDVSAYAAEIEKGRAILKEIGSPGVVRVWQAIAAGPNAGQVVVSIEYADLAAYAADFDRTMASKKYQGWLKDLSKIRTIVSDSLYRET